MSYEIEIRERAIKLRKAGHSFLEIAQSLHIAKSTCSIWLRSLELNATAQSRLKQRKLLSQYKTIQRWKEKKKRTTKFYDEMAANQLLKVLVNAELYKLLCSFLFWTEGGRATDSFVYFINSDPLMVETFMCLLRKSFNLDETKLRAMVHIHEYHNEKAIKRYWSKIINLPLSQFSKSYLKPHTKKRIREGYLGSIRIRYYDYKVALELRSVYNIFAKQLIKGA